VSDYTQITDFSAKDALASGDANKKILGSDVDAELAAISTAIATKGDDSGLVHTTGAETVAGNKTFSGTNTHSGAATFSGGATVSSGQTLEVSGVLTLSKGADIALSKGADIASANDLALGTDGNYFDITGTTTINGMTDKAAGTVIKLHFDGAVTLTHAGSPSAGYTKLYCIGAANYTTTAGDEIEFVYESTDGWRMTNVLNQDVARTAIYTSSDTFVVPGGVTKVRVTAIAAGGGGGGTNSGGDCGGGGGSGGQVINCPVSGLTPGASITVTIGSAGAGGVGAAIGSAGGNLTFGSYITLTGGGAGAPGGTGTAGAAGTSTTPFHASAYTSGYAGGTGATGTAASGASDKAAGLTSGSSTGNQVGHFGYGGSGNTTGDGTAAGGYGCGGGGAMQAGAPRTGGNGSGGYIMVEW